MIKSAKALSNLYCEKYHIRKKNPDGSVNIKIENFFLPSLITAVEKKVCEN